jgi:peptide-methionine (S)-S-oxide reductase
VIESALENSEGADMKFDFKKQISTLAMAACLIGAAGCNAASAATAPLPNPAVDEQVGAAKGPETMVIAGGCFWGVQDVFEHTKGVLKAVDGYAGGSASTADYETVSTGTTGHAESVKVTYDPSQVTYGQLLKVFFTVAADPTELNRQGPDEGTQYRSVLFYANDQQKNIASSYIAQLNAAKVYSAPIVTQVTPLKGFFPAESYHQDYAERHPENMYIVINDAPKVVALQKLLPDMYVKTAVTVAKK